MSDYGKRADGTVKGRGFLGPLRRPDGSVSSELSMGTSDVDGQEREIPLLVPTLSEAEIEYLLQVQAADWQHPVMRSVSQKAIEFARQRRAQGRPFFAEQGEEQQHIYPQFRREDALPGVNDATLRPMPSHISPAVSAALRRLGGVK